MPKQDKNKAKNFKKTFGILVKSLKKYHIAIVIAITISMGASIVGIFIPKILGEMTNIAVNTYPEIDFGMIGQKAILVAILLLVMGILSYTQGFILAIVSARYTETLRNKIIDKINHLPISYFDKHKYGDTLSRMTNDVDILATSLSQEITDLAGYITTLVGTMIMMLTISLPLSLVAFIVIPLSVIIIGKITKFAQKYFAARQTILGELDGRIEEDYSGEIIIKSNSYEPSAVAAFNEINDKLATTTRKAQFFSTLSYPMTHILTNLIYVAICALGGWWYTGFHTVRLKF